MQCLSYNRQFGTILILVPFKKILKWACALIFIGSLTFQSKDIEKILLSKYIDRCFLLSRCYSLIKLFYVSRYLFNT